MAADYLRYVPEFIPITVNGNWSAEDKCNAVTFWNFGTAQVTINQIIVLEQGQQFGMPGELGEAMGNFNWNIAFAAGTKMLVAIKKVYV